MSESDHQAAVIRWARMQESTRPVFKLLYAIPNGGARAKATAWRLKQEGVKPGVPDLCLPVARQGFHGLYIEVKNDEPRGALSMEQKKWILALRLEGYAAYVCFGGEDAMVVLDEYVGNG